MTTVNRISGYEDPYSERNDAAVSVLSAQAANDVQIRWMLRRDMPQILAIEAQSFEWCWSENDFLGALRQRNCIGMVAERGLSIVGFMIYALEKHHLHLLNLAVARSARRTGVGAAMLDKLARKLSAQRRQSLVLEVCESNLVAQQFFRAMGLRCVETVRQFYEWTGEDAYRFVFHLNPPEGGTLAAIH